MKIISYNTQNLWMGKSFVKSLLYQADIVMFQRVPKEFYLELKDSESLNLAFTRSFPVKEDFEIGLMLCSRLPFNVKSHSLPFFENVDLVEHLGFSVMECEFQNSLKIYNALPSYPDDTIGFSRDMWKVQVNEIFQITRKSRSLLAGDFHMSYSDEAWLDIDLAGMYHIGDGKSTFWWDEKVHFDIDMVFSSTDLKDRITNIELIQINEPKFPLHYPISFKLQDS